jgi:hypothetical protein
MKPPTLSLLFSLCVLPAIAQPSSPTVYGSGQDGFQTAISAAFTDAAVAAANEFLASRKDFISDKANSQVMIAYIKAFKLDPREKKTYERAYKDLKRDGLLELNSK